MHGQQNIKKWCEHVEWSHITQKRLVTAYYGQGNQPPCSITRGRKNLFLSAGQLVTRQDSRYTVT